MIRNLICHVYPRRTGQQWRRTVEHLLRRRELFGGRRIITIATDETTDTVQTVRSALADFEAEFLEFRNCALQETSTFLPAMDLIANTNHDEITFRCHAKGSTHSSDDAASHIWADAMFETCLDYPELVDCMLEKLAIVGPFRSHGLWPFPGHHGWHYAGSMFWVRHDRTFSRDWRQLMPTFFGVEAWPGIFPIEESGCLFGDHADTQHLYSPEFWRHNITPSLQLWRESLNKCGLVPISEKLSGRPALAT